jgi:hypothetical protein
MLRLVDLGCVVGVRALNLVKVLEHACLHVGFQGAAQ